MQTKQGQTFAIINGIYSNTRFYNVQTTYLSMKVVSYIGKKKNFLTIANRSYDKKC